MPETATPPLSCAAPGLIDQPQMDSPPVVSHRLLAACALGGALVACGSDPPTDRPGNDAPPPVVQFVDLPMFVGHRTVTHVVAHDPAGVTHVELYLDDMRVAAAEFAPFDATWDATGFTAGAHTLRAHAYTSDGRTGDATTQVQIEHTAPTVTAAPTARRDDPFVIAASDSEAGVAQIVVQRGDATIATLTAPPYQFAWPSGACGNVALHIVATDQVGNQRTLDTTVAAVDTQDLDCDGAPQVGFGGGDCDDSDPAYNSHVADTGASIADFNCDGVPGVDGDRDGVPSVATGGTDCNDASADTHAAWLGWTGRALHLIRDAGGAFAPGFVALADSSTQLDVAFVDQGALYHGSSFLLRDGGLDPIIPEQVATGVDEAPTRHPVILRRPDDSLAIVFYSDAGLQVATRSGAAPWVITTINPPSGLRLGRVVVVSDQTGALHLVYEADGDTPSSIRYATNRGGTWSVQTLPEGVHALEAPQLAVDSADRPHVIYETATALRHAVLDSGTWTTNTVFTDSSRITRYALGLDPFQSLRLVAVLQGGLGGQFLESGFQFNGFALDGVSFAFVSDPIDDLAFNRDALVVRTHDRLTGAGSLQAWTTSGASQDLHASDILGTTRSPSADLRVVVAGPGASLIVASHNRSVSAPLDPSGGPDLDCNGTP